MTLTLNDDDSYSISTSGLTTNVSESGTITGLYSDYSGGVGAYVSAQANQTETVQVNSITLETIPEPSSYALIAVSLGLASIALRRRPS